jgi:universal stress protein E
MPAPAVRRILVALKELQARSIPAVLKAGQLAKGYGAQVELFHSLETPLYLDPHRVVGKDPQQVQQELRRSALRRLESIADRIRQRGVRVSVSAEYDSPTYAAIIRRAVLGRADLIVAAGHAGRHRWPGLLRLTDWELVRLSPVPVLLVKSSRPYRRPQIMAAVDPTHAFAKPLRLDRLILDTAAGVGTALHGTLHAVHAYPRIPVEILAPGAHAARAVTPERLREAQRRSELSARAALDRLLRGTSTARTRRHALAGHPLDVIAAAARSSRCAMVVMGAVSRSGIRRILIGNTAERILDALGCDVLVVKPRGFRSPVPRVSRSSR